MSQANWVNIRTFGAVGDGIADDTAEINTAIDAFNTKHGQVFYAPAGKYKISGPLNRMWGGGSVFGDGRASTIFETTATTGHVMTLGGPEGTLRGIGFTAAPGVVRTSGAYLYVPGNGYHIDSFSMENCYLGLRIEGGVNSVTHGRITGATSRRVSPGGGYVQVESNSSNYLFDVMGGATHNNTDDYPSFAVNLISGAFLIQKMEALQADIGLLINPGPGQTVVNPKVHGSYIDNMVSHGVLVRPWGNAVTGGVVTYPEFVNVWSAPLGGNAFTFIQEGNTAMTHVKVASCTAVQYNLEEGTGVHLQSSYGPLEAEIVNCDIGTFETGILTKAGTRHFKAIGNQIYANTAIEIEPGYCDQYRILHNSGVNKTAGLIDGGQGGTNKTVTPNWFKVG